MCGRYTLSKPPQAIVDRFGLTGLFDLAPRYNIAPAQPVLGIICDKDGAAPQPRMLWWGLVPPWADSPSIGNRMINARAETVASKPAYRKAFERRRCLIPADGFYEWRKTAGGDKVPTHIHLREGGIFAFAGLWERWTDPDGEALETCVIITTQPNNLIRPIHDRMPAILQAEHESTWLDPTVTTPEELLPLLGSYPDEQMEGHPVSRRVNRPGNDDPRCVEPVESEDLF